MVDSTQPSVVQPDTSTVLIPLDRRIRSRFVLWKALELYFSNNQITRAEVQVPERTPPPTCLLP